MKNLLNFIYGLMKITLGLILIYLSKDLHNPLEAIRGIIGIALIIFGVENLEKATK